MQTKENSGFMRSYQQYRPIRCFFAILMHLAGCFFEARIRKSPLPCIGDSKAVFRVSLIFVSLLLQVYLGANSVSAQVPQSIKYQTVLRSLSGQPLVNRPVQFGISIQQGLSGPIVYQERHTTTTNNEGLVVLSIGRGVLVNNSPAFTSIDWSTGSYFEVISIDTLMNNNFIQLGSFELLSVPYTLHSGNGLASGNQLGQMMYWDGNAWSLLPQGQNNQILTYCNGQLIWAASGQCPGLLSSAINCSAAVHSGVIHQNQSTTITSKIPYTGGNGGFYPAQSVSSTGVTGLTATLPSGNLAVGNDSLVYTITGTPVGSGTASFLISLGGQFCTLNLNVIPAGGVSSLLCGSSSSTGSLVIGVQSSGVSNTIIYTGGNGGLYSAQTISSTGVSGLNAVLTGGAFNNGTGTFTLTMSGTPASSGTASFTFTLGGQSCTLTRSVAPALISGLSCNTATHYGTLTNGISASGVSSDVPYTGGNGGFHLGQSVASTGVGGLTATVPGGFFAVGSGILTYTITGTPTHYGVASFALNIGGHTCTLTRVIGCSSLPTAVVDVTSPSGMVWMDRNLGAARVATSPTDSLAFGDLYQWGRSNDGHQCRVSQVQNITQSSISPGTNIFYIDLSLNWHSPQDNNLWQGVNGVNNPCPAGYRLPTQFEWQVEYQSWSSADAAGAFASPLKLTLAGQRTYNMGNLWSVGQRGFYYHSTLLNYGTYSSTFEFDTSANSAVTTYNYRSAGMSVRCRKN